MIRKAHPHPIYARQRGATLVIALLTLVVIMLTGLAVVDTSSSQFKLSANSQFESVALNRAEAAVATAEDWLKTGSNMTNAGFTTYSVATPYLHPRGHLDTTPPITMAWTNANSLAVNNDGTQRYLIERLARSVSNPGSGQSGCAGRVSSPNTPVDIYRITARAEAGRRTIKFVQTIYSLNSAACSTN